jgi:hypothetical protein
MVCQTDSYNSKTYEAATNTTFVGGIRPKAQNPRTETFESRISRMAPLYHKFVSCTHRKVTRTRQLPTIIANDCEPGTICEDDRLCPDCLLLNLKRWVRNHTKNWIFPESDGTFARFDPDGIWMIRFGSCSTFLKRYLFMR